MQDVPKVFAACLLALCCQGATIAQDDARPAAPRPEAIVDRELADEEYAAACNLKTLARAEAAYAVAFGQGRYGFGTLEQLAAAGFLQDAELAAGEKSGYKFSIRLYKAERGPLSGVAIEYAAEAVPVGPHAEGRRRIGVSDTGSIYLVGRPISCLQHPLERVGCTIDEREKLAVLELKIIAEAQAIYRTTRGDRNFGTLMQLHETGLVDVAVANGRKGGYFFKMSVGRAHEEAGASATKPQPTFMVTATPVEYGVTARKSFYVDETGVVRGDDLQGKEANSSAVSVVKERP